MGVKYGLLYHSNDSFSTVKEGLAMVGPKITLHFVAFELMAGILKEIDGSSAVPTLGFGIRLV